MSNNDYNDFIASFKSKCLTKEQEAELVLTIQRGKDRNDFARNRLIEANMYWSWRFALKYQCPEMDIEDLWQAANEGLIDSIASFDPTIGVPFHEYAKYRMGTCILEAINRDGREFNLPKQIQDEQKRLRKVVRVLTQRLGREPLTEEIADEMKQSTEYIYHLQSLNQRFYSVDDMYGAAQGDGDGYYADTNEMDNELSAGEPAEMGNATPVQPETLMDFDFLPPLDREIFVRSRGLLGHRVMTHAEILDELNSTRKANGKSPLTMEDVQIHYCRAAILDRCQD